MLLKDLLGGAGVCALLGMCKNAGKTTALNRLIREYAAAGETGTALTSVGRDGEGRDLVTGTEKPPIYVYEGMLCATVERLLPLCDVSRELLALPELYTPLGRIAVFRARSDGYVQLAGPSIVEQLAGLRALFETLGADRVLIDGALGRRSPAAGAAGGACLLSTGASLDRDLGRVVAETAYAVRLLTLPEEAAPGAAAGRFTLFRGGEAEGCADMPALVSALRRGSGGRVLLSGALTEAQGRELLRSGAPLEAVTVLAGDGSRYLLGRETAEKLFARGLRLAVLRGTRLAAVTVNPVSAGGWRFDRAELLEKMRAACAAPVVDVEALDGAEL